MACNRRIARCIKKAGDVKAYTLAQYLLGLGRCDAQTGAYLVTNEPRRENGFATVVIDEASMLTEDRLAARLDALDPSRVQRFILVGDPRQLPPIGAVIEAGRERRRSIQM
jgi:ATP-dependent exoDNAse (exonuclease V) alpha subunit